MLQINKDNSGVLSFNQVMEFIMGEGSSMEST